MQTLLGPMDLRRLQMAHDKLGWMPPDSDAIAIYLRGETHFKGKALDLKPQLRIKWIEDLYRAQNLDRKEQALALSALRADIGEWLDHYSRGGERPAK